MMDKMVAVQVTSVPYVSQTATILSIIVHEDLYTIMDKMVGVQFTQVTLVTQTTTILVAIVYLKNKVQQVSVHLHLLTSYNCDHLSRGPFTCLQCCSRVKVQKKQISQKLQCCSCICFVLLLSQLFESIHDNTGTVKGESEGTWTSDLVTTGKSCM